MRSPPGWTGDMKFGVVGGHWALISQHSFGVVTWFGLEGVATSFFVATWPVEIGVAAPF